MEIKSVWIEGPAYPNEHAVMLFMLWIPDSGEEFFIASHATDVLWWGGACPGDAQRIKPIGVGFGDRGNLDAMAPAVTKIVFVDELADGIAENGVECVFL